MEDTTNCRLVASLEELKCNVCGKNLYSKGANTIMLSFGTKTDDNPDNITFMKKFMGPYDINRTYNICGECVLKTFGVKPEE